MEKKPEISMTLMCTDGLLRTLLQAFFRNSRFDLLDSFGSASALGLWLDDPEKSCDLTLVDLNLGNREGLAAMKLLQDRVHSQKVIVFSNPYAPAYIGQLLRLNASAYVDCTQGMQDLLYAMERVAVEGTFWTPAQMRTLSQQLKPKLPKLELPNGNRLSEREQAVLALICQQKNTQEIADALFMSPKTVEGHKTNLLAKTGARNSVGLAVYAIKNKLWDPLTMQE